MRATAALLNPTKRRRAFRKLPLTTKDINKGFYKGTRTGRMGSHTTYGTYKIDWDRVRTYVVPEGMQKSKLTPFVYEGIEMWKDPKVYYQPSHSGPWYLKQWKLKNGVD